MLRNPVKARLCKYVENYRYSSLNVKSDIWNATDFFNDSSSQVKLNLDWLNLSYEKEIEESIQKALNKKLFEVSRCKKGYKQILPNIF